MLRSRPAAVVRDITQFFEDKRFDPDAEIKLYDIAKLMLFLKRDDDTHARTEKKNLQTWLAATYPPTFTNVTASMLPDIIRGFLNIELDDDALLNSILTRKRGRNKRPPGGDRGGTAAVDGPIAAISELVVRQVRSCRACQCAVHEAASPSC